MGSHRVGNDSSNLAAAAAATCLPASLSQWGMFREHLLLLITRTKVTTMLKLKKRLKLKNKYFPYSVQVYIRVSTFSQESTV